MRFAQVVFKAPQVGLLFGRFSLGPPYAKSAKMADLGGFARFTITRLCGQFWRRRLRQTADNISTQTAPPKLPAKPSYGKSSKATQIGHFRRFCIGGTKGKPPKKKADLRGLKNNLRKSHDIFISMRLKCKQRTTFRRKRRLQNCPQSRVMVNLAKPPKSAIFADFA